MIIPDFPICQPLNHTPHLLQIVKKSRIPQVEALPNRGATFEFFLLTTHDLESSFFTQRNVGQRNQLFKAATYTGEFKSEVMNGNEAILILATFAG